LQLCADSVYATKALPKLISNARLGPIANGGLVLCPYSL
jgi:hypothetical protein